MEARVAWQGIHSVNILIFPVVARRVMPAGEEECLMKRGRIKSIVSAVTQGDAGDERSREAWEHTLGVTHLPRTAHLASTSRLTHGGKDSLPADLVCRK
ncbi:hypothetical protein E2C01_074630 [Portunus trituberculatus]|uniref:Uncharacterized protein n=1 Tax=Portunus trituberculatus TaxID=210409 RepID=A0A5B7ICZ8_PORTR|nr:hypothetical protein [Portunus trituberculatus]